MSQGESRTALAKFDLPERDAILDCLREAGRPLARKELAASFKISDPEERRALGYRLKAMKRDGQLIRNRRGSYGLIEKIYVFQNGCMLSLDLYIF